MVEINIPNVVTIGLIGLLSYAAVQFASKQFNIHIPFLTAA